MLASALPKITDPRAPAAARGLDLLADRLWTPLLADPRDVIFTRLLTRLLVQVLPLVVGIYLLPSWAVAVVALPYIAFLFVGFGGPVMLGQHAVAHRPLFRKPYRRLDRLFTHLFPMLMGMTPFAYRAHHIVMHHSEGNGPDDLSSTVAYERDNPWHFLHYWARFTFFGYLHLGTWLWRRGWKGLLLRMIVGESLVFLGVGLLFWWKPAATALVLVTPWVLLRFLLMAGNWSQHAFCDPDDPTNDLRNATCLINVRYNHRCYNDGYHIVHHRVPGLHWTEMPGGFERLLPQLVEQDAVIFDGLGNNQTVFWKLMRKDYGALADHLLDLGGRRPSREEKIAFLQERVRGRTGALKGMLERCEAA